MKEQKRYHPLIIGYQLIQFFKHMVFPLAFFFLIKLESKELYVQIGKIALIIWILCYTIYIVLKWFSWKYTLDDETFHFYSGILNRSVQTVPIMKIQDIQQQRTPFHRLFSVTSAKFNTAISGEDAHITFQVISLDELERIETHIESVLKNKRNLVNTSQLDTPLVDDSRQNRRRHFQATKKDTFKATFTSLSFFIMIPILLSLYSKANEIFSIEQEVGVLVSKLFSGWISGIIAVIFLIIISFIVGLVTTYIRYGRYEIYSDENFIYIHKGILNKMHFSIAKDRVQAIEIRQSLLKKWLGLAEIRLISAGIQSTDAEKLDINSLYPFLPYQKATEMLKHILPAYEVTSMVNRLPHVAIYARVLTPSLCILTAGIIGSICFIQQWTRGLEFAIIFIFLCFLYIIIQIIDIQQTRYALHESFFQVKKGVLLTSLFLSNREKIIEIKLTQSPIQKFFRLATFEVTNRANPVHQLTLRDISLVDAKNYYIWYMKRRPMLNTIKK